MKRNAVVLMARCSTQKKLFGIRTEEKLPDIWLSDWAFAVDEDLAEREGYTETRIEGTVDVDLGYPGCPYCEDDGYYECGICGKINCWDRSTEIMTCAWCTKKVKLAGSLDSLSAGSF